MSCGWVLVLVSQVLLLLCAGHSRCAPHYPQVADDSGVESERFQKRYDDEDYDSFVGLMGRRSTGPNRSPNPSFRSDMNDIFVGLLGRRNAVPAAPAWRGDRRGNFLFKNRRLRFCCAV